MRSIVWLMTLGLVTAAVAMVATVEYQRRYCSRANRHDCVAAPCVTDLPSSSVHRGSDVPELLQGLGIMSARVPQSDSLSAAPAFQPRPDLAGAVTPQALAELEQLSRITASALVAHSQPSSQVTEDEFTFPQPPHQPSAVSVQPTGAVVQTRDDGWWRRLGHFGLGWTNQALNSLQCRWRAFCLWLERNPKLVPATAVVPSLEPPKLPGLLEDAVLPMPATAEPARAAVAEPGSQAPFFAAMQVALGVPIESALADGLSSLFTSIQSTAAETPTEKSASAGALAAWNAELADDGNAVIQATYTAMEPAQVELASHVVVTRFYPITKALASGQTVEQVIAEICQQVAPRSWTPQGGLGTVVYYAPGRTLVIRQTPAVHSELERFFSQERQPLPQPMPAPESKPGGNPEAKVKPEKGKVELAVAVSARPGLALEIVVCDGKSKRTVTAQFPPLGRQRPAESPCCRSRGNGNGCENGPGPITSGSWAGCPKDGPATEATAPSMFPKPTGDAANPTILPVQHLGPVSQPGSAPGPWWRLGIWQQRQRTVGGPEAVLPPLPK
jgi:hypothetical protein